MISPFNLADWWFHNSWELQTFLVMGILSMVALVLQAILTMTFGHDGDIGGIDHDSGGGSVIFSIKGMTAAFFGFSWTGAIVLLNGGPIWLAVVLGVIAGLLLCTGYLAGMRAINRLQSDGTFKLETTIGGVGTIYVAVPPKDAGSGLVIAKTKTRNVELKAYNTTLIPLEAGRDVKIVAVYGAGVSVEPLP